MRCRKNDGDKRGRVLKYKSKYSKLHLINRQSMRADGL